jgi:hypothetical protein
MPIEDATFFLDELARLCGERGLEYTTYPMHEVTAHPRSGHDPGTLLPSSVSTTVTSRHLPARQPSPTTRPSSALR